MHDETLLSQWHHKRDGEAFHALTLKYGTMIYATALRILRNPKDAEDITQTCFEKLATTRRVPHHALGPWLHRVAVNAALDWRKREQRRGAREATYQQERPESTTPTWDDIYPLVDEAIAALPESQRFAVVAHYLEQRTHGEIAAEAGVSREAITQRIHRGVDGVRATLKERGAVLTAATMGTLLSSELARAAAMPSTLKTRLGHIAVSGIAIQGASGLLGVSFTAKAVLAAFAVVAGLSGLVWMFGATDSVVPLSAASPLAASPETATPAVSPVVLTETSARESLTLTAATPPPAKAVPALSGRVFDVATGKGIAGATVTVVFKDSFEKMVCDEEGDYQLATLLPGTCRVECRRANGYLVPVEYGDETMDREFEVTPDTVLSGIDFALTRGEGIRGRVVDAGGQPVADALVTGGTEVNNYNILKYTHSAEDGTFALSGFPPSLATWVWAETASAASASAGPIDLAAIDPNDPEVELQLQNRATIRGRVIYSTGKAVADASVFVQYTPSVDVRMRANEPDYLAHANPDYGTPNEGEGWSVESDAQGNFELAGLSVGSLSIHASAGQTRSEGDVRFVLEPGETVEDVELVCPMGTASIRGRVVDARGSSLPAARVQCFGIDVGHQSDVRAGIGGSFELTGLEPGGHYRLTGDKFGDYLVAEIPEVAAGETSVRLVLEDLPRVEGRVVDADTGEPVTRFKVNSPLGPRLLTHPQGYVSVESEEGRYSVKLSHLDENVVLVQVEGYALGKATVMALIPGEVLSDVDISIKRQADFNGIVRDESGQPVPHAILYSGDEIPGLSDDTVVCRSEEDGSFTFPAFLLAHDYLTIKHPDFGLNKTTISDKHRAGKAIEVTMTLGAVVAFEIYENGVLSDQGHANINLSSPYLNVASGSSQSSDGKPFIGLTGGRYVFGAYLTLPEGLPAPRCTKFLTLEDDEHRSLRVDFSTGTAGLEGLLTLAPDLETMLELTIDTPTGEQTYRIFQATENYHFGALPAGEATLTVRTELPRRGGVVLQRYAISFTAGTTVIQDIDSASPARIDGNLSQYPADEALRVHVFRGEPTPETITTRAYSPEDSCGNIVVLADGSFSIPGLLPGTYTLAAMESKSEATVILGYGVVELGTEDVSVTLAPVE